MITKLIYKNSIDSRLDKQLKKKASRIEIINDYKKYLESRRKVKWKIKKRY